MILATALLVMLPLVAHAGPTAGQSCESGKNGTAGKYASCLHKAQAKFVKGGEVDTVKRDAAVLSCGDKYSDKWSSLETKAMGACPSLGDASSIQDFLDACIFSAEDALGGGVLPSDVVACNDNLTMCSGDLGTCNSGLGTCNGNLATCSGNLGTCNGDLTTCSGDLGTCDAALSDCGADLAGCEAQPFAQPLKTGQINCWNGATPTPCAGTAQDGELQKGIARSFTDNGNGTLTDNATGLMWEKLSDDGSIHDKDTAYTWANAFAVKIANLNTNNFGGHNDWRLPNRFEMETMIDEHESDPLVHAAFKGPCTPGCDVTSCSCTATGDFFWSSTTVETLNTNAWRLQTDNADMNPGLKTNTRRVRAVRGEPAGCQVTNAVPKTGQTECYNTAGSLISCAGTGHDGDIQRGVASSYTDNGDGTITDNLTGLMWEKQSDNGDIHDKDNTYTWANAFASKVATLNSGSFAGYGDWRVPNRKELDTLVNLGAVNPSAYAAFNSGCVPTCTVTTCSCTRSSVYWSSSTYQDFPTNAWLVNFYDGFTSTGIKTNSYGVRAVRAGS
ncbi:MAG: DUF1566 domain-containing protein [Candidatus Binatia bacterium]